MSANDIRIQEAVRGDHGERQQDLAVRGLEWLATILRKNTDYNASAYSPPILLPRMRADTAILVRMSDKAYRIASLIEKGTNQVQDEKLEDAVRDLGGYCLLWLCVKESCEPCRRHDLSGVGIQEQPDATDLSDTQGVSFSTAVRDRSGD